MINDKGVYTTKCPKCTRSIVMHILSDGSISPSKCPDCELLFSGIDKGKERNTFVIVPGVKKSNIFANEEVVKASEVDKKEDTKKTYNKTKRESFKIWKDD